jgi:hypothetical protein
MQRAPWTSGKAWLVLLVVALGAHVWMLAAHGSHGPSHVDHDPAGPSVAQHSAAPAHAAGESGDPGAGPGFGLTAHSAATCMIALLALGLLPDLRARVRAALSLGQLRVVQERIRHAVVTPYDLLPAPPPSRIQLGVQLLM